MADAEVAAQPASAAGEVTDDKKAPEMTSGKDNGVVEAVSQDSSDKEKIPANDKKEDEMSATGSKPRDEGQKIEMPTSRTEQGRQWNNRERRPNGDSHHKKRPRQNKFDPASQKQSSDPVEIRKQVEFYFSDSNLLTDRFLFHKVEGHKNVPVEIDVIHSFKRMARFQPRSAVVAALKDSKVLNVVEDDTKIQRKTPLPEDVVGKEIDEVQKVHESSSMARSVYAKGFGDEKSQTQFDIEAFFANYGPTNSVRLRRQGDGLFKGSVFVEFDSEETQKAFLALDPKPKWDGKDLQIKSKKAYCDSKVEDIKAGRIRANSPRRKYDDNDWKKRREEDQKSGFKDKRGGGHHRGRGRGNWRGGDRRDRNDERKAREDEDKPSTAAKTEDTKIPDAEPAATTSKPAAEDAPTGTKRTVDEVEDTEGQGEAKKVDAKEE